MSLDGVEFGSRQGQTFISEDLRNWTYRAVWCRNRKLT